MIPEFAAKTAKTRSKGSNFFPSLRLVKIFFPFSACSDENLIKVLNLPSSFFDLLLCPTPFLLWDYTGPYRCTFRSVDVRQRCMEGILVICTRITSQQSLDHYQKSEGAEFIALPNKMRAEREDSEPQSELETPTYGQTYKNGAMERRATQTQAHTQKTDLLERMSWYKEGRKSVRFFLDSRPAFQPSIFSCCKVPILVRGWESYCRSTADKSGHKSCRHSFQ